MLARDAATTKDAIGDPPDVLVATRGLGVRREGRFIVRGIDISVRRGEIVTLIGPNGGGKTTTARAALGLISHEEGNVQRRPGLRIGYVPQRLTIDRTLPLTVARFMQLTRRLTPTDIASALERVGLAGFEDARVQQLSGGEFQRALLGRALLGEPELLVLDEPVQGVDLSGEVALYELIGGLRQQLGCGILMISHDLHVVMAATDTVVCINGHVCCQGSAETVQASPEYHRLFGHRAASALAVYRHRHDHTHGHGGVIEAAATAHDGDESECAHCSHAHGHSHDDAHEQGRAQRQGPTQALGHAGASAGAQAAADGAAPPTIATTATTEGRRVR